MDFVERQIGSIFHGVSKADPMVRAGKSIVFWTDPRKNGLMKNPMDHIKRQLNFHHFSVTTTQTPLTMAKPNSSTYLKI